MPVFSSGDKNILFVHVPKAAGTTIEHHFMESNDWRVTYRTRASYPENKVTICTPQHFHGEILPYIFDFSKFDCIFTVVRNPYERFKSEYAMRHKKAEKYDPDTVAQYLEKKIQQYGRNPYVNDNHIRPQFEYMVPGVKMFKLENGLEPVFSYLSESLDMDIAFDPDKRRMTGKKCSGFSSGEVELNDKSIKLLNDFYENDFTFLNYRRVEPSGA